MNVRIPKQSHLGRPPSQRAGSHTAIMDAVHELLQETSVRDLTMEAVAQRARVGKPTLYKWWPSKAALVFAMFHERLASEPAAPSARGVEGAIYARVRRLVGLLNGLFGKVMADLIAEGQSDPELLRELYDRHIAPRRSAVLAEINRAKADGELSRDADGELLIDAIFGAVYFRRLLRTAPLTEEFGDQLVKQVLRGVRSRAGSRRK